MLPTDYKARKEFPLLTVLTAYFPDAIEALVELCIAGNKQHEVGKPVDSPFWLDTDRIAWDRSKSTEDLETLARHLWDHTRAKRGSGDLLHDADGVLHIVKVFWRAGAEAQKTIEALRASTRIPAPAPQRHPDYSLQQVPPAYSLQQVTFGFPVSPGVRCAECGAHGGAHFGSCSGVGI